MSLPEPWRSSFSLRFLQSLSSSVCSAVLVDFHHTASSLPVSVMCSRMAEFTALIYSVTQLLSWLGCYSSLTNEKREKAELTEPLVGWWHRCRTGTTPQVTVADETSHNGLPVCKHRGRAIWSSEVGVDGDTGEGISSKGR